MHGFQIIYKMRMERWHQELFEGNAHVAGRVLDTLNPDGSADDTGNRYENSR